MRHVQILCALIIASAALPATACRDSLVDVDEERWEAVVQAGQTQALCLGNTDDLDAAFAVLREYGEDIASIQMASPDERIEWDLLPTPVQAVPEILASWSRVGGWIGGLYESRISIVEHVQLIELLEAAPSDPSTDAVLERYAVLAHHCGSMVEVAAASKAVAALARRGADDVEIDALLLTPELMRGILAREALSMDRGLQSAFDRGESVELFYDTDPIVGRDLLRVQALYRRIHTSLYYRSDGCVGPVSCADALRPEEAEGFDELEALFPTAAYATDIGDLLRAYEFRLSEL